CHTAPPLTSITTMPTSGISAIRSASWSFVSSVRRRFAMSTSSGPRPSRSSVQTSCSDVVVNCGSVGIRRGMRAPCHGRRPRVRGSVGHRSVDSMTVPQITLDDGVQIPQLGFGTWQIPPAEARDRVAEALEVGYRHIDTAQMYGNEAGVGAAIAAAGLPRAEVFVTTKLNNNRHDPEVVADALGESLEKLQLDKVDLFLIHWPLPMIDIDFVDTWKAMEEVYAAGKARAIGVSNFQPHHLRRVVQEGTVVPAVNQIEIHPYFNQA